MWLSGYSTTPLSHTPAPLCWLQLTPPAGYLSDSGLPPVTCIHCHETMARPISHSNTLGQPGPPQLQAHPKLAQALAVYFGALLTVCLYPEPATTQTPTAGPEVTCVHRTSSGHNHCQLLFLAVALRTPQPRWMLHVAHQWPCIWWFCGTQKPELKRHHTTLGSMLPHDPTLGWGPEQLDPG